MPLNVMQSVARAFNRSKTTEYVVLFRSHSTHEISDYGFNLKAEPEKTFTINMFSSGESYTASLFRRQDPIIYQYVNLPEVVAATKRACSKQPLSLKDPKRSKRSKSKGR